MRMGKIDEVQLWHRQPCSYYSCFQLRFSPPFPSAPSHLLWVAAFSAYLNYPLKSESLPSPTACTRASAAASVFSDVYYFLNIYHLFHKSVRRNKSSGVLSLKDNMLVYFLDPPNPSSERYLTLKVVRVRPVALLRRSASPRILKEYFCNSVSPNVNILHNHGRTVRAKDGQ
jgi:hypothetical protein